MIGYALLGLPARPRHHARSILRALAALPEFYFTQRIDAKLRNLFTFQANPVSISYMRKLAF